jgi:hypothetical protein
MDKTASDVHLATGEVVVKANHLLYGPNQAVHQVRTQEAGTNAYQMAVSEEGVATEFILTVEIFSGYVAAF